MAKKNYQPNWCLTPKQPTVKHVRSDYDDRRTKCGANSAPMTRRDRHAAACIRCIRADRADRQHDRETTEKKRQDDHRRIQLQQNIWRKAPMIMVQKMTKLVERLYFLGLPAREAIETVRKTWRNKK